MSKKDIENIESRLAEVEKNSNRANKSIKLILSEEDKRHQKEKEKLLIDTIRAVIKASGATNQLRLRFTCMLEDAEEKGKSGKDGGWDGRYERLVFEDLFK